MWPPAGVDDESSSDGVVETRAPSARAPAANSARLRSQPEPDGNPDDAAPAARRDAGDRTDRHDGAPAVARGQPGRAEAARRGSRVDQHDGRAGAAAAASRSALRRARARADVIAVDDAVTPAARDDVAFDVDPARSPRPDRSPAFAASIKRPAFFADEDEAARPGGPVQHTPPRSPVQREVFADDYDEAEAVETDDGQTAGDEEDDDVCAACGQQPTMRCPCLTASYCSSECQRAHWRTHKRACPLRRSRASSRTASEVSVAAEAAEAAGPTFATAVAAQSTQNGDRREGEAYAASTAATYDGSTASGADADTDEWSRSRAYSAASAPSTAAVYDGSAASGAGEDTDDWSRDGPNA